MKTVLKLITAASFAFAISLGSVAADEKSAAAPINETCPVKEGKKADGSKTYTHTVQFCCENCKGKFDEKPTKYVSKVAEAEAGKCPLSGRDINEAQTSTFTVAVCCGGCVKKITENPAEYLKAL